MYNLMLFMHATSVSTYDSVSDLVFFLYNAALEINSTALNCFNYAKNHHFHCLPRATYCQMPILTAAPCEDSVLRLDKPCLYA